jgi:hypothetical protein
MSTLLHRVLNDIAYGEGRGRFERPTSVDAVMQLILGAATGFFIEKCVQLADGTSKGPLEVFRESIREVVRLYRRNKRARTKVTLTAQGQSRNCTLPEFPRRST